EIASLDQFRFLYQGCCARRETRRALQENAVPAHARRAPTRACRRTRQRWSHSSCVEFQSLCPSPSPPPFSSDRMLNYTNAQLKYAMTYSPSPVGLTRSPSLGRINGFDQDEAEGESDEGAVVSGGFFAS